MALPVLERILYWSLWIGHSAYAWLAVYRLSSSPQTRLLWPALFTPGWLGWKRDLASFEWDIFFDSLPKYVPVLCAHSLLFAFAIPQPLFLLVWLSAACYLYGYMAIVIALILGVVSLWAMRLLGRVGVWAVCLLCMVELALLSLGWSVILSTLFASVDTYNQQVFLAYQLLHLISYADCCIAESRQQTAMRTLYIDWLFYSFYPPYNAVLICIYRNFRQQFNHRWLNIAAKRRQAFFKALRIALWLIFNHAVLHLFYFSSMILQPEFLNALGASDLAAVGYVAGQFFHMKYVVMFGVPSVFALLDGFEPPKGPVCISRVSLYGQMWREFDRGLYSFLHAHLYEQINRILAALLCFLLVWIWHGGSYAFLVWASMNFVELLLEKMGRYVAERLDFLKGMRKLHPNAWRRLTAISHIPCTAFGIFSITYFLSNSVDSGNVFLNKLVFNELFRLTAKGCWLLVLGYAFANCCIDVQIWQQSNRMHQQ